MTPDPIAAKDTNQSSNLTERLAELGVSHIWDDTNGQTMWKCSCGWELPCESYGMGWTKFLAHKKGATLQQLIAEHTKGLITKQEASEQVAAVVEEIRRTVENGINGRGVYVGDSVSGGIHHIDNFHDLIYWLDAQIFSERDSEQILTQRDERVRNEQRDNDFRAYKVTLNGLAKERGIELNDDYPCNMVKRLVSGVRLAALEETANLVDQMERWQGDRKPELLGQAIRKLMDSGKEGE